MVELSGLNPVTFGATVCAPPWFTMELPRPTLNTPLIVGGLLGCVSLGRPFPPGCGRLFQTQQRYEAEFGVLGDVPGWSMKSFRSSGGVALFSSSLLPNHETPSCEPKPALASSQTL